MLQRCDFCKLEKDRDLWFEQDKSMCLECCWKTDKVSAVALTMFTILTAAAMPSRRRKKNDAEWLYKTSERVKGFFQSAAQSIYPSLVRNVKPIDRVLIRHLDEKPTLCARCPCENPTMFFQFEDGKWSSICKVCRLLQNKEDEKSKKQADEAIEERKRIEKITFYAVEKTKVDRYSIQCMRCKQRFDPLKVRIVAAICEGCCPPDEKDIFLEMHDHWTQQNARK